MMRHTIVMLTGICLATGILAVGAADSQEKDSRTWAAPRAADEPRNPLQHQPDTWAGGTKVFLQRCAACHASDGTGTSRGPNLMTGRVQQQSDGALFWKISSGNTRGGMPSFSFLPAAQRWQLVSHLRTAARQ